MVDENFLIPVLLSGIAFKSFYGFDYDFTLQQHCPWFILEPRTKKDTKAVWEWPKVHYKVVRIWMERKFSGN